MNNNGHNHKFRVATEDGSVTAILFVSESELRERQVEKGSQRFLQSTSTIK